MEYIDIACDYQKNVRLDLPTAAQVSALAMLFDDGKNHQICFMSSRDIGKAGNGDEFSSMIASADIVLPVMSSLLPKGSDMARDDSFSRRFPIPFKHRPYIESMDFSENDEFSSGEYSPLKTLTTMLGSIERLNGSIFLLGGRRPILQRAEANMRSTFPSIRLVGLSPGDYEPSEESSVIKALQKSTPDIIVTGSFLRGGELWIPRHMVYTRSGIFIYSDTIIEVLAGSR
jgi:N-acetylglucosaminyldiphosphoundecaprenol N-acetyl-beta-D-mannosaminyltransferase